MIVERTTYTLTPLVPFDSIEWYDLYHHDNTIEFTSHPANHGLSRDQLFLILILNRYIPGCGEHYMHYLPHGLRCSKCKQFHASNHYTHVELSQKDCRVCRKCWDRQDHWNKVPFHIKKIINIDLLDILPIYSQHQARTGHTYIQTFFYVGQKSVTFKHTRMTVYVFEFRLWNSTSIHALLDQHGYMVAVNFDRKWSICTNTQSTHGVNLYPCLVDMKPLTPVVMARQWIVNKARFGFV